MQYIINTATTNNASNRIPYNRGEGGLNAPLTKFVVSLVCSSYRANRQVDFDKLEQILFPVFLQLER